MSPRNPTPEEIVIVRDPSVIGSVVARVIFPRKDAFTYEVSFPAHKNPTVAEVLAAFQLPEEKPTPIRS